MLVPPPVAFGNTTVATFQAEFTIDSPIGFVEGTKEFVSGPNNFAFCFDTGAAFGWHVNTDATYTATITTPTGSTCTTQGTSFVSLRDQGGNLQQSTVFEERFTTGTVPVCTSICPADEDDDGDGLTNRRESLFSTLLRNSDSDRDGIRDGNDDANRNGEDDEDEDDNDNGNECPDEDSDDDGEDDEDEDDDDDEDDRDGDDDDDD